MIDGALEKIEANYVFPDVAKKMAAAIRVAAGKEGVRLDHEPPGIRRDADQKPA